MKRDPYPQRQFKDVAGSFNYAATSPVVALLGMLPISNKASIGINDKGIWLWHIDAAGTLSLRLFPQNCQLGFFEWPWIREIQVSYSRKMAYFLFHDLDAILQKVLLCQQTEAFQKAFLTKVSGKPALQFPLVSHKHFTALDYVASHHYTHVFIVE